MSVPARRAVRAALALVVASGLAVACERHGADGPPAAFSVVAEGLAGVDNLALAPDGSLYASLERPRDAGIVHVAAGKTTPVLGGLTRTDGLLLSGGMLYVTEEIDDGRVLEVDPATGTARTITTLGRPEGIDRLPDGDLVVSEDMAPGRILRVSLAGEVAPIAEGLVRPEGLAVGPDGTVYVCETATGRVLRLRDGAVTVFAGGMVEPDQVEVAADGALWVTEDRKQGRLLRVTAAGAAVMAEGLSLPQGIALAPDGTVYVAEQGRGRILAFPRDALRARGAP